MKKKRLHSFNVLDSRPTERRLWQFSVEKDDLKLGSETTVATNASLPEKIVQKDWHELYQPKLNIALLPVEQVFLRVVQLPVVDRQELLSMLEFQLEKLSPLPVAQVVWSVEVLPASAEKTQTAIVCVVARDLVEQFLGSLEATSFQPDRLEVPNLNQIIADGQREDGGWIYPGSGADADTCTVAWWSGGTLQQLQFLRLPMPAAQGGEKSPLAMHDVRAARSRYLHEQLMQVAWAGELEGWLTLPVKWRIVADEQSAAYWEPLVKDWSEDGVELHPAVDRLGLAKFSSKRILRGESGANLLPPEYAARYHQQYTDRLWMRALGAVVMVYVFGVIIYMIALQFFTFKDSSLKTQIAGIANTYTNVLKLKERVGVMEEQLTMKYAALDCCKVASELLPEGFNLVNLILSSRGRTMRLEGTAPPDQREKIIEFNDAMRKAEVNGKTLFKDVTPPNMNARSGSQNISWNFDCRLNVSDAE